MTSPLNGLSQGSRRNVNNQNPRKFLLDCCCWPMWIIPVPTRCEYQFKSPKLRVKNRLISASDIINCKGRWGPVGTCGTNMAGGLTVPREAGIIVSWVKTAKKCIHYKDLKVQQRKPYKELTSSQPHRCLIKWNTGVGGCQACLHLGGDIPTGFFLDQVYYIQYIQ